VKLSVAHLSLSAPVSANNPPCTKIGGIRTCDLVSLSLSLLFLFLLSYGLVFSWDKTAGLIRVSSVPLHGRRERERGGITASRIAVLSYARTLAQYSRTGWPRSCHE
jgi:hypothetical protein